MATTSNSQYYLPAPSHWPLTGSVGLFTLLFGGASLLNGATGTGKLMMAAGIVIFLVMLFGWFGTVVRESNGGLYNDRVDISFRLSMGWFIFSEVMFFAAFFGALFYARMYAVPWLGGIGDKGSSHLLWPDFTATWPLLHVPNPSKFTEPHEAMGAWGIPAMNTLILLTSGATVTWAHWGLKKNNRRQLVAGLLLTIALGALFLGFQAHEYIHAYTEMNLRLTSGVYGSTFFMLTGFHGLHVTIGAIMLSVIFARSAAGDFTPTHHFAFEAVSWYWHFVDVVWLGLFVCVYLL